MRRIIPIAAAVMAALILAPDVAADEEASERSSERSEASHSLDHISVVYRGTLQDEEGGPVSGVFPLTFKLYRGSMSANPIWEETHFVSVVDGRYQVPLGHRAPLGEHLLQGERWMGVELTGEAELLRDRVTVEHPDGEDGELRSAGQQVSFADVAERAIEADRARTADNAMALDGMTAQEIEDLSNLALRRLGEHIADPEAHSGRSGASLGSRGRAANESAGGRGGTPYDIRCPEGHVVTGIQGSAGRVVDNVTVICTPLE